MGGFLGQYPAWLLVIGAGVSSSIGNLMLKQSRRATEDPRLIALLLSPWFLASLIFFVGNLLLLARGMERLPVAVAIAINTGVNFAAVTVVATFLFGESLNVPQYTGLTVIALGCWLLAQT
jgi:multidrug transporter EmrE-like cation transporter